VRVFLKWDRVLLCRAHKLIQPFNAVFTSHKQLDSARIANKIRFSGFAGPFFQFATAQKTGKK
jgi:hypothetical protein